MRLDYALYGLAIVLFALTAITFACAADAVLYAAVTAIVGVVAVGGGYALRPKTTVSPVMQTPVSNPEPTAEVVQQMPSPSVDAPTPEKPQMATPTVEASASQSIPENEAPKVEEPTVTVEEPKVAPEISTSAVAAQVPEDKPDQEVCPTPTAEDVAMPIGNASPAEETGFGKIRGISAKRAEQLKANGINTIEELANADAAVLAEKLGVSPKIVKMWIGCAKKQAK
jgi:predicted flap endonuclease-1-like 5' DNA nuclease